MNKTVNEVYQDYSKYIELHYKPTTVRLIKFKFKNYILPFFGETLLKDFDANKYIDFVIHLKKFNYSNSFYHHIHGACKKFFDYIAITYSIENIPAKVGITKYKDNYNSNQKKGIWTVSEFKKFIKYVDCPIYHALFVLLFYTGLRKGEALALKVSDFKNGYIIIHSSITNERFNGERMITSTKTKNSNRVIKLDIFTRLELNRLIKYYSTHYNNFNSNFFLFGGDKPIAGTTLERKKNNYCKIAGVKQIRIHDFRHSHATMLYNKKVKIKAIQERLGHADISTTLNVYVHSNKKHEKRLINTINLIRL